MATKKDAAKSAENEKQVIEIIAAAIKDDFCHYEYRIIAGKNIGDSAKIKGAGIVMDDMKEVFGEFRAHLAVIDDVFKHKGIEVKNIKKMNNDELTALFFVEGFKIIGGEDNESIVLMGTKSISSGGRIEIKTPPIPLSQFPSYKFHKELLDVAERAREEVQLYREGKYTIAESKEVDEAQLTLTEEETNLGSGKIE